VVVEDDMNIRRRCRSSMIRATFAVLCVVATSPVEGQVQRPATAGGTDPSGTWKADPPTFLTVVLESDGSRVTGALSTCSTIPFVPSEITEGRVDGDTVTFTCTSDDGDRTVAFKGKIGADEITFDWNMEVRDGGRPPELFDPFAPLPGRRAEGPPRFIARRVPIARVRRLWRGLRTARQHIPGLHRSRSSAS
jgi:hypothetical protein